MTATLTIGMAEAKTNFSRITADANRTGMPITVFKNNKPWVEIRPLSTPDNFDALPKDTRKAIDETEAMLADPKHVTYKTASSVFAALGI